MAQSKADGISGALKIAAETDKDGLYRLWYNGRRDGAEYIGYACGRIGAGEKE